MAPIIDHKRSQPHKENNNVNASSAKSHTKKGLEILDFHESWLEEMELYKDRLVNKHHHQHHQHHQQHTAAAAHPYHQHQQLLLGAHNHLHTPQGCLLEAFNSVNGSVGVGGGGGGNGSIAAADLGGGGGGGGTSGNANGGANNNLASAGMNNAATTRKKSPHKSRAARSVVINNATISVAGAANANANANAEVNRAIDYPQLHLKRPREESTAGHSSSNAKRHGRHKSSANLHYGSSSINHLPSTATTTHAHSHNTHSGALKSSDAVSSPNVSTHTAAGANGSGSGSGAGSTAAHTNSCNIHNKQTPAKIIVSPFHASSLLSAHRCDDKAKILTQNGLTKSAATAYETSLYASNYLTHETAHAKINAYDFTHYNGVSLAKNSNNSNANHPPKSGHGTRDEDPGAAIDDVNDDTETDSEEDYTGEPFYLKDDGDETHQSRSIRNEHVLLSKTNTSEDSEGDHLNYYTPKSILTPSLFPNVPPYLNFSSHANKGPAMPASLHKVLKWKLSPVMPRIVKRVVLNSGFRIIKNTTDWMAIWEKHMKSPGFRTIRSHQKYNHMPGSFRIGRKDTMWRSIHNNMKKYGVKEFGFMQRSYIMPDDLENLRLVWPKHASKLTKWIVKPPASARGTGIRIINKWSQFPKDRPLVVQKYIERPLLINDSKFDMRIYVVLTSINPLRIYMHKDGLARFASVKYSSELNSLDERCMHLTNYSINKFSQNYSKNEDFNACQGHKWTLQSLWSCLEQRGVNTKRLWATLRNLVIKAIISGESGLNRMYRQNVNFRYNCFEMFGFDVLLDENIVPWLLEINISPSLHSELPLDLHVKGPLIQAVLNTAMYQVPPKLNEDQQEEILKELKLTGPLCHDKRIFTTCLTTEEVRKHNQYTNRSIEYREEYVDTILENLLPDDVRCLIIAEDEYARCKPLERIFPTSESYNYLQFIDNPRYYNRLLDAWEYKYGHCRAEGIKLLHRLCEEDYHLQVSDAALEKEPEVQLTEIDMLHAKKSEDPIQAAVTLGGDSPQTSKAGSTESAIERLGVVLATTYARDKSETPTTNNTKAAVTATAAGNKSQSQQQQSANKSNLSTKGNILRR